MPMATMKATRTLLTAQEAAAWAPQGRWELIRGEVVEYLPSQPEHGAVVNALGYWITDYLGGDPFGQVLGCDCSITEHDAQGIHVCIAGYPL